MRSKIRMIVASLAMVLVAGCASEKSANVPTSTATANATPTPTPDTNNSSDCRDGCTSIPGAPGGTGTNPTDTGYASGSTSNLVLSGGTSRLAQMFYNSNPNNPSNVRINVDLNRSDSVIVSYIENGQLHEAGFSTNHPNTGTSDKSLNGWVTNPDGKKVWKGFFQDRYGAVIVIIDQFLDQGDGKVATIMGGSIWFQNFNQYWPNNPMQGPIKMCWQITRGPYDCRTWIVGSSVVTSADAYPTNYGPDRNVGYVKLGDFAGIAKDASGL